MVTPVAQSRERIHRGDSLFALVSAEVFDISEPGHPTASFGIPTLLCETIILCEVNEILFNNKVTVFDEMSKLKPINRCSTLSKVLGTLGFVTQTAYAFL